MSHLLLYKNPYIFDRLDKLNLPYLDDICTYQIAFLANTGMGVDRTKESVLNYIPSPIPEFRTSKSFDELMYQRAIELKECHEKVTVLLSGTYSMAVVKALKFVGANFDVLTTKQDVDDFNNIYTELLKNITTNIIVDRYELTNSKNYTGKIISGSCGRQLFTYPLAPWFTGRRKTLEKKRIFITKIVYEIFALGLLYRNGYRNSSSLNNFFKDPHYAFTTLKQKLEDLIERSPVSIENTFDLYWWLNFNLAWYSRKCMYIGLTGNFVDVEPFYDTEEFQSWSIVNHENKSRKIIDQFNNFTVKSEKTTLMHLNLINNRKTTWKLSFADSLGNIATEPSPVTLEMVRNVLK